jgi:hypothetical protein
MPQIEPLQVYPLLPPQLPSLEMPFTVVAEGATEVEVEVLVVLVVTGRVDVVEPRVLVVIGRVDVETGLTDGDTLRLAELDEEMPHFPKPLLQPSPQ